MSSFEKDASLKLFRSENAFAILGIHISTKQSSNSNGRLGLGIFSVSVTNGALNIFPGLVF